MCPNLVDFRLTELVMLVNCSYIVTNYSECMCWCMHVGERRLCLCIGASVGWSMEEDAFNIISKLK